MFNLSLLGQMMVFVFAGLIIAIETQHEDCQIYRPHWNYHEFKGWKEHFSACGGAHQSPISLKIATAKYVPYSKITFGNYDKLYPELFSNNGHTVQFNLNQIAAEDLPYITGGGLDGRYIFEQLHFHWGVDAKRGSEHTINGRTFPAELHMVHYNSKYGSFNDSVPQPDGLAILGILIQSGPRDNPAFRHLDQFSGIQNSSGKTDSLSYLVPLSHLLPRNNETFYRYRGALATPGCNEDVTWTVFDTPITISRAQFKKFRKLRDDEGRPLKNNFRPVQELHDRVVTYRARVPLPAGITPAGSKSTSEPKSSVLGVSTSTTPDASQTPVLHLESHPFLNSDSNMDYSSIINSWFNRHLKPNFPSPRPLWNPQMQLQLF